MCILIMIPNKASKPNEAILDNCWKSNPDGAGFMYPDITSDRLIVSKGHMNLDSLKTAFALVPDRVPVCVHFRIKTHGDMSPEMTHPHWVWPDETAIAHNGILPIGSPSDSAESDTARFARLVLANLPKTWWRNDALVHLVEEYMGRSNKLVTMNKAGSWKILNEAQGVWSEGVWFSNQTFRSSWGYGYPTYDHNNSAAVNSYNGYQDHRDLWTAVDQERAETGKVLDAGTPAAGTQRSGTPSKGAVGRSSTVDLSSGDPLPAALENGRLSETDVDILRIPIGEMTEREWAMYSAIMGDL